MTRQEEISIIIFNLKVKIEQVSNKLLYKIETDFKTEDIQPLIDYVKELENYYKEYKDSNLSSAPDEIKYKGI